MGDKKAYKMASLEVYVAQPHILESRLQPLGKSPTPIQRKKITPCRRHYHHQTQYQHS